MMDKTKMTDAQRTVRCNVRNFLLLASETELVSELRISESFNDTFLADCIKEIMGERADELFERNRRIANGQPIYW